VDAEPKKPSTLQEQVADYAPQLLNLGSWNKKVIKLFSSRFSKSKLKIKIKKKVRKHL